MEPTSDAPSAVAGADRSTSLTRVPIDQALLDSVLLRPEPAGSWYRHEVRRLFLLHLIASIVVLTVVTTGVALAVGRAPLEAVAGGFAIATLVAAAWTSVLVFVLPLTVRQARRLIATPVHWVRVRAAPVATPSHSPAPPEPRAADPPGRRAPLPDVWDLDDEPAGSDAAGSDRPGPDAPVPPRDVPFAVDGGSPRSATALIERCRRAIETAHDLVELGFAPVATLRTESRPTQVVDLYRAGDRVVASIDRTTGELLVLTELVGLRVLVTSGVPSPPTDELVVNVVGPDTPTALVASHQRLVADALSSRTLAGDPIGLFRLAHQRRVEGHRGLGPWWAAVLDRRVRTGRPRLAASPPAGELLLLTGNRVFRTPR